MKNDKLTNQETLLLSTGFVFGGLFIYILFLLFFTFYPQLAAKANTYSVLQFLNKTFFHKGHLRIYYLILPLVVLISCFFAYMFMLVINKFKSIKLIIYTISSNIWSLINKATDSLYKHAQTKNIKTSKLLGKAYLLVLVIACFVAVFSGCLHIKETNFIMVIVMPLTTVTLIYGVGFTLSNYIRYFDPVFPQHITDSKKLFKEVLKFFIITIAGMLLMLIPLFSKIILFFI